MLFAREVQPRIHTSGNTRGNILGPFDKPSWSDTTSVWNVPYKLKKKTMLGDGNMPLPGGACPVDHEAEGPPRQVDMVPAFFHAGPSEVAMEVCHFLQAVAIIDLTPASGHYALEAVKHRIPYTGVCLTESHKDEFPRYHSSKLGFNHVLIQQLVTSCRFTFPVHHFLLHRFWNDCCLFRNRRHLKPVASSADGCSLGT